MTSSWTKAFTSGSDFNLQVKVTPLSLLVTGSTHRWLTFCLFPSLRFTRSPSLYHCSSAPADSAAVQLRDTVSSNSVWMKPSFVEGFDWMVTNKIQRNTKSVSHFHYYCIFIIHLFKLRDGKKMVRHFELWAKLETVKL